MSMEFHHDSWQIVGTLRQQKTDEIRKISSNYGIKKSIKGTR